MKKLFFASTLLLLSVSMLAQQDSLPQQWTLEDCIRYAQRNNITLQTLRLSASSAQQDLQQSRYNRLPNLTGSASQSLVNSNNADPVVGGFQTQANFSSSYGVNSSMVLFNGGYLKNDIKSKDLLVQSANLSVEESANDITLTITQAYLNILLAQENITSLEQLLTTSKAQLDQGQQRFDAGAISRKDFLQLQSQLATDNYNLVNAQNTYRRNVATLKQILQLPTAYDFRVSTVADVQPEEAVMALPDAQAAALASRPEVKNGNLGVQIAQVELDKIRASRLPTVSLGAGLSSGFSDNRDAKYFAQLNNNFYQSLGLNVSVPIFTRHLAKTNIAKSKILIDQAKLDLENTRVTLNATIEQALINLQNAQAQYKAAEEQLTTAKEVYNITNEQLKLGAVNPVEVLQQKNAYVQALQAYTQAKYTAVLYNKIYTFYTGAPISF